MVPTETKEESAIGTAAATASPTAAPATDADAYHTTNAPISATIPVFAELTEGMNGTDLGLTTATTTTATTTTEEGITNPRDTLAGSPEVLAAAADAAADPAIVPTGPLVPGTTTTSAEAENTTTHPSSDPAASAIDKNVADPLNGSDDIASQEEPTAAAPAAAPRRLRHRRQGQYYHNRCLKNYWAVGSHQSTDGSNSNATGIMVVHRMLVQVTAVGAAQIPLRLMLRRSCPKSRPSFPAPWHKMPRAPPPLPEHTTAHSTPQTSHLWSSPSCGSSGGRCRTRTSPPTSWKEVTSTSRLSDCSRSARTTMIPPKPRRRFFSSRVRLLSRPPTMAPPTASWSKPLRVCGRSVLPTPRTGMPG
ncbi:unnamed protein product [Ectocarpus sp. 13 AM-2016]